MPTSPAPMMSSKVSGRHSPARSRIADIGQLNGSLICCRKSSVSEIDDPWFDIIRRYLDDGNSKTVTIEDVLTECLNVKSSKIDNARSLATRVGYVLKRAGWTHGPRRSSGNRARTYLRPGLQAPALAPEINDCFCDVIRRYLEGSSFKLVTVADVLTECFKVDISKIDNARSLATRVGYAFKRAGWKRGPRKASGSRARTYLRPEIQRPVVVNVALEAPARAPGDDDAVPF